MNSMMIDIDKIKNFKDYMDAPVDTGKIMSPSHFRDEVVDLFCGEGAHDGVTLPFPSTHGGHFKFRPGECSIWAGCNGAGKSSLLTMSALHWLFAEGASNQEEKILIISPEMTPRQNLARLVRQGLALHPDKVTPSKIDKALDHFEDRLWIYNHVGNVQKDILMGLIRYAARELGVTQVIFDNITILKFEGDPMRDQKHFITDMVEICRDENIHIHTVAHSRKPESGQRKMVKYDIRGASEQSDLVDNVVLISRNEAKQEALEQVEHGSDEWKAINAQSDTRLEIAKQRHGDGWTGAVKLAFWPAQMRWEENSKRTPEAYF